MVNENPFWSMLRLLTVQVKDWLIFQVVASTELMLELLMLIFTMHGVGATRDQ